MEGGRNRVSEKGSPKARQKVYLTLSESQKVRETVVLAPEISLWRHSTRLQECGNGVGRGAWTSSLVRWSCSIGMKYSFATYVLRMKYAQPPASPSSTSGGFSSVH